MASGEDRSIGKQFGSYRIIAKINSGRYGSVYKAQHLVFEDDPLVAIKLLRELVETEADRALFFQEARLLKKLRHSHILPILDASIQDDMAYIVMEYASRGSLKDRLDKQSGQLLPQEEALTILRQIGEALHYAHQQNVVHRDLKPDNILFNARGEALLADFGIAAILTSGTKDLGRGGTPAYMAPEQFEGKVSPKSDQYALGCIAYELVTGRKPFDVEGVGMEAVWFQHAKVTPPTPKQYNPRLSESVARAILTALAKQRTERYVDIAAFIAAVSAQKTAEQWFAEGYALIGNRRYEEGMKAFEEAIRLKPDYATAYYNIGVALHNLGRYEEAINAHEEAIRLKLDYVTAYYSKGVALGHLGRYKESINAHEKAIRLKPDYADAYYSKGIALHNLGRYEEAIRANEEAIRLNPNYATAYYNMGIALQNLGRTMEAQQAFAKAKELGYKG